MFREIHNAVQEERATEADSITNELSELYMMLETGRITEQEFDAQEEKLLDRLDTIRDQGNSIKDGSKEIT